MTLTYQRLVTPTAAEKALLLLADPNRALIDAYLPHSTAFVASNHGTLVGVLVLQERTARVLEIMNVAVAPQQQRHGYGTRLLTFADQWASDHGYQTLQIATGTTSLTQLYLYQKQGFRVSTVERDYFTRNYPQTIIENGLVLRDRLVLTRSVVAQD